MTERERMVAGDAYDPADPDLIALRLKARQATHAFNATLPEERERRKAILRELFGTVAGEINVEPSFHCDYGCNIHVGENFYANFDCVVLDVAPVRVGRNCLIGPQVGIYTATHPLDAVERAAGLEAAKPVVIGDDCWIGGNATINPGVSLGDRVVVASGSVVTRSFPSDVVIGGNPARILRRLDPPASI